MKTPSRQGIQAVRSLKASEVGEILGYSQRSVRRLAEEGSLPGYRPRGPRGSWRFTEESVRQFLEARQRAYHDEQRRRVIRPVESA